MNVSILATKSCEVELTSSLWANFGDGAGHPDRQTRPHTLLVRVEVVGMVFRHRTRAMASLIPGISGFGQQCSDVDSVVLLSDSMRSDASLDPAVCSP